MAKYKKSVSVSAVDQDRAARLLNSGQHAQAEAMFRVMLAKNKNDVYATYHMALILHARGQAAEGLLLTDRGIATAPKFAPVWGIRAMLQQAAGDNVQALASYGQAIRLQPDFREALLNSGVLLREMFRHHEALARFEQLLALDPNHEKALGNCATLLAQVGQPERSIAMMDRLVRLNPDYPYGPGMLFYERLRACDWTDLASLTQTILAGVRAGKPVCRSFALMAMPSTARDQFLCAQIFAQQRFPKAVQPLWQGEVYRHERLRIAYVSPDFREHPVSHLMCGIFERHDRSRFETIAISIGAGDQSRMRSRLEQAFDQFIDVSGTAPVAVARRIRELEIDILIDLAGYTSDARPEIFALRPAPVQVNFLGYPGSMASGYHDYIVADRHVIPPEHEAFYSEQVVCLPDTYLPTDADLKVSDRTPSRSECGLPESGPVLCAFSHNFKVNSELFDAWMRILARLPGSVLWLASREGPNQANLRREAKQRGIDPARLVFAVRVPLVEDHLARYRLADLFLDTSPYNAHTTAADALMAGLPVVTYQGEAFPSRVAASLLHAIGLPELITASLADYERLVVDLVSDAPRLQRLKSTLQVARHTSALFDSERFCRNFEAALLSMRPGAQRMSNVSSEPMTGRTKGLPTDTAPALPAPAELAATSSMNANAAPPETAAKAVTAATPATAAKSANAAAQSPVPTAAEAAAAAAHRPGAAPAVSQPADAVLPATTRPITAANYASEQNRAAALFNSGRVAEAEAIFRAMLARNKSDVYAIYHIGLILFMQRRPADGLRLVERALVLAPRFAPLRYVHGMLLNALGRSEQASRSYEQAIKLQPDYQDAILNSGVLYREMFMPDKALERFKQLLMLDPDSQPALGNCATLLSQMDQPELAIPMFARLVQLNPAYPHGLGMLCYERMRSCDWTDLQPLTQAILDGVRAERPVCRSFALMALPSTASDHLMCARTFARERFPLAPQPLWQGERYHHDRVRIAYVSPDFREHPVSHLMSGIYQRHDRSRFETIAISIGMNDHSRLRARLETSFDQFIDMAGQGALEVARRIRELEVDILIDMAGYTSDARPDIYAHRPAPVQVNFLGYPGTMASGCHDYILADRHVIPPEHEAFYTEKVVRLPDTYLPTDAELTISERTPTRAECGLPESGPVLCAFSHNFKIGPALFDAWMRILQAVPDSVLWLAGRAGPMQGHLMHAAQQRGIDPARLVFARRVPRVEDHLARYRLADLFLDTSPYNAHTTAADALTAGLPVVTYQGEAFPSRVAASLLHAIGLPELITPSLADYEALVIGLLNDRPRLDALKARLAANRHTHALFDSERFCRNLEAALLSMRPASRTTSMAAEVAELELHA